MATKVLDSWALIAFLEDEPAAEAVEKLLAQAVAEQRAIRQLRQRIVMRQVMELLRTRVKTITDFATYGAYFFRDPTEYEEAARLKHWKDPHAGTWLAQGAEEFAKALTT